MVTTQFYQQLLQLLVVKALVKSLLLDQADREAAAHTTLRALLVLLIKVTQAALVYLEELILAAAEVVLDKSEVMHRQLQMQAMAVMAFHHLLLALL
jgi:hypothetical protein